MPCAMRFGNINLISRSIYACIFTKINSCVNKFLYTLNNKFMLIGSVGIFLFNVFTGVNMTHEKYVILWKWIIEELSKMQLTQKEKAKRIDSAIGQLIQGISL